MVIVNVVLCLLTVPDPFRHTALLVYEKFASMSNKRTAIIEFYRAGWCNIHFSHLWSKEVWPPS